MQTTSRASSFAHRASPTSALRRERIPAVVVDDHDALARARRRAHRRRHPRAQRGRRRNAVLGLATGSTPIGVYRELIRMHREEGLSFAARRDLQPRRVLPDARRTASTPTTASCGRTSSAHVDIDPRERAHPARRRSRDSVDGECAGATRQAIRAAGGIDFQILGIGKTGHIGFNEPGSGAESRTRLVTLDAITRRDAAADFFGEENVPREAITMGVATILEAREIAILATGEHKAAIVRRAVEGEVDVEVAATFLQRHPNATFYLDARRRRRAHADRDAVAARRGARGPTRWRVRAVVWLSQT